MSERLTLEMLGVPIIPPWLPDYTHYWLDMYVHSIVSFDDRLNVGVASAEWFKSPEIQWSYHRIPLEITYVEVIESGGRDRQIYEIEWQ